MKAHRTFPASGTLTLGALGIAGVATAVLVAFPGDLRVWQVASWTLVFALLGLLALVLFSAFLLATRRAARTWRRIVPFSLGLACLAVVAFGAL